MTLQPCGTPAAAARHRRDGEELCESCLGAERERVRHWRTLQPCGTIAAAARHRRAGEELCDPCLGAERLRGLQRRELERLDAEALAETLPEPPPRPPPAAWRPGRPVRGSAALRFAEQIDRLPDHDGTILFVARLVAPLAGRPPPSSLSRAAAADRHLRSVEL